MISDRRTTKTATDAGRRRARRTASILVALVAALVTGCIDQRLAREFSRADVGLLASPALHVLLCGTGTGLPDARRAGPCVAVVAGGAFFLIDVGAGAWKTVDLANLPIGDLKGVLVTKLLADDLADVDESVTRSWLAGRVAPLAIYGPPGTGRLAHAVQEISALDAATRLMHHDAEVMHPRGALVEGHEIVVEGPEGATVVLEAGGLRVTAFSVAREHDPPSVGYRFDYRGRSVVIAGHSKNHPNVVRYGAGADILIHEAVCEEMLERGIRVMDSVGQARLAHFTREMLRMHATAEEAAEAARAAGARQLVLTGLAPAPNNIMWRWAFLRGVARIFPHVVLGEDGMRFRLDPR